MSALRICPLIGLVVIFSPSLAAHADEALTADEARGALHKAVDFFRSQVSAEGGYLWAYSSDLSRREGERSASAETAWVQPPGTPTVGQAFLEVYQMTGDRKMLDAARETAMALVRGQLRSGGWHYRIEFGEDRSRYAYRVEPAGKKQRNVTTLDDNTTQSALRFLMRMDQALNFRDRQIHDAVVYAIEHLLQAQYPNGAWPQRFSKPPNPEEFPVKKASYPESWPRQRPDKDYQHYYTFNDNSIADMIETMLDAAEIYRSLRCRQSAERAGGFILLAQMPEPQPAWAQQYNRDMHPAWARKFEPPAVTGGESKGVIETLMTLYRRTGNRRYLEPIPRALAYLESSEVSEGKVARFYELKTNRPLYFTKEYELTYEPNDLPTHYGFIVSSKVDSLKRKYERVSKLDPAKLFEKEKRGKVEAPRLTKSLIAKTRAVIEQMDDRGAWVESGRLGDADTGQIITSRTFVENIETLGRFIAAKRGGSKN